MVPDVNEDKGHDTKGLLYYLFGPGKREEHTDPHMVASWNPLLVEDPGEFAFLSPSHTERMRALARYLDLPVKALSQPPAIGWVWHCPVRNAPEDRLLSDEEWATVARRIMHATNLAREGDEQAVRWVAVRHAEDHIHIVATLARQDGRAPRYHNDSVKAQAECRKMEREFGLRRLNAGDGTAAKRPTTAEIIKAERLGQEQPSRLLLQQAARRALSGARSEEEFFSRLEGEGVLVKMSYFPSGDPRGYSLAVLDDTNAEGAPIWYPGAKLAPDLSLPKIRSRFPRPETEQDAPAPVQESRDPGGTDADTGIERPVIARRQAAAAVENAVTVIVAEQPEPAAGEISDLTEVLDALAETTTPGQQRTELLAAARAYDRASRSHVRAVRTQDRALRRAANDLWHSGYLLRSSKDGGASAWLLSALVLAVFAVANWHAQRGHHQQAAAARESAQHLRRAYQQAAGPHYAALQREGRRLPGPVRQRHRNTVLRYHPHQPRQEADEATFDALAYTLHQAEQQGHDPGELLRQATAWRELDTAQDVTAVLVWRIRNLVDPPAPAADTQRPERAGRHGDRPQTPDGPGRQR